ncbi:MAG: outer membrane beta-barrel protein [Candidatus Rokubacteria bacterium]|nr:outer membrane beta-barrel protein [Candidatus Rokubacteria bacterium]MBI3457778.1 outer membrane beta-barrel protein [Candidatus Rokubacteria bacterium]
MNVDDMMKGTVPDMPLKPNDIIVVPQRLFMGAARQWKRRISPSRVLVGLGLAVLVVVLGLPQRAAAQEGERGLSVAQAPAPAPGVTRTPAEAVPAAPPPATVPSARPPVFPAGVTEILAGPAVRPRAVFELHPSISLSEEYTDNFDLTSQNKQDNFRTSLAVGLVLLISGTRTKGQIAGSVTGAYDSSTGDVDPDRSSALGAELAYEASPRLKLTARDDLTRSDEPLLADQLTLRRVRREFTTNTFALTSDYRVANVATREYYRLATFFEEAGADTVSHTLGVGASTALYGTNPVGVGYEFLRSETSRGGPDVTGHQVSASLARQLNPQATVGVSGSYAWRGVSTGAGDYTLGGVSVFAGYSLPQIWSASASVGYSWLHPEVGADTSSITTATTLTYRFARAVLSLTGSVGFSETFAQGENFGVVKTRGVQASLSYPLTPFITGTGSVFYRENTFTDVAVGPAGRAEIGRTEHAQGGSLLLTMPLLRWLTLGLEYTYTDADSSVPGRDYTENRARATLSGLF